MKNVRYYSDLNDVDNNFADSSVFLRVNCAGRAVYPGSQGRSVRRDYYLIWLIKGEMCRRKSSLVKVGTSTVRMPLSRRRTPPLRLSLLQAPTARVASLSHSLSSSFR